MSHGPEKTKHLSGGVVPALPDNGGIDTGRSRNKVAVMVTPRLVAALLLGILVLFFRPALADTVRLPLRVDHNLLSALVVRKAFGDQGESAVLYGSPADCTFVRLAEPRFSSADGLLRLRVKLYVRTGTAVGDSCFVPLSWQGYLELLQRPHLDSQTFQLSFTTVDSSLYSSDLQPATIAGVLWEFAKPLVHDYLDAVRIDLGPPVQDVRTFLLALTVDNARQQAKHILDSLRGGGIEVDETGVEVRLLAEVAKVYEQPQPARPLSPEERQTIVALWETWDAFLVHLLLVMADGPLSREDQVLLSEVLLDTRYAFAEKVADAHLGQDLVRQQFISAWQRLAPVFRRQLYRRPTGNMLGYLAFFTAADALEILDRLGPAVGLEISQQGLLELARMLAGQRIELPYRQQVDPRLRQLLELPSEKDTRNQAPAEGRRQSPLSFLSDFMLPSAYAADLPEFAEILRWRAPRENVADFVQQVRAVLAQQAAEVLATGDIPSRLQPIYKNLVDATAWQESCFRQFVVRDDKLTYLLSYNNSSVGVMQINERVWRGLYNRDLLRWDIHYNSLAGCEILSMYLRRYVLGPDDTTELADVLLARALYAMYNGGPGQYSKFLAREKSGDHYRSDIYFQEKLQWVRDGEWSRVDACLIGS